MRSSSSLLGRVLLWIALRLDILTKIFRIIFNENPCSPCVPWIFGGVASQEIFGGNLFKEVAYARNNLKFREAANKIFN